MGNNLLPAEVTIKLHIPREYDQTEEGKQLYLQHLNQLLQDELADIMAKHKPTDKWLGVESIKRVDPFTAPKTESPLWILKPNFISADRDKRYSMWLQWKSFQIAYKLAWNKCIDGDHEVEFPLGTYKMRLHHNVKILAEYVIFEMPSPYE
ncbi:MAG: hypothetical protein JXR95_11655 [Deltaproteobacteria bacterium]|nr:hypothetical protein [Deltaproteobacteria bacterium]